MRISDEVRSDELRQMYGDALLGALLGSLDPAVAQVAVACGGDRNHHLSQICGGRAATLQAAKVACARVKYCNLASTVEGFE